MSVCLDLTLNWIRFQSVLNNSFSVHSFHISFSCFIPSFNHSSAFYLFSRLSNYHFALRRTQPSEKTFWNIYKHFHPCNLRSIFAKNQIIIRMFFILFSSFGHWVILIHWMNFYNGITAAAFADHQIHMKIIIIIIISQIENLWAPTYLHMYIYVLHRKWEIEYQEHSFDLKKNVSHSHFRYNVESLTHLK